MIANELNLPNPTPTRGVFSWRARASAAVAVMVALNLLLAATTHAEVFVSVEEAAQRLAAESERAPTAEADPDADWHAAAHPLLVVHVGHGRRGYDRGHLPGAIYVEGRETYAPHENDGIGGLLPEPEAFAAWLARHGIGSDHDVLLYGDAAGVFPARVYAGLAMLGLERNVRLLDGHLREWVAQGQPVSSAAASHDADVSSTLTADGPPTASRILSRHAQGNHDRPASAFVIDSRAADAFAGEKRVPGTDQRGHLPGSANLPWRDLVPDIKRPVLIADADQRIDAVLASFRTDTAGPNSIVVLDDRGNGAAVLFAILRHFGHDAYWDQRGLLGRVLDGETLVADSFPKP